MSFHIDPAYQPDNSVAALLDMIRRRAPHFMRCGGGGNRSEHLKSGRAVSPEDRQRAVEMLQSGTPMRQIAAVLGVHYSTIVKYTREVRKK